MPRFFSKKRARCGRGAQFKVFASLFSKSECGCGAQSPTDTAFSFRQAFSFGPIASKEKASSGEAPAGNLRRLLSCNRTRSPEGDGCKEKSVKQVLIAKFCRADSRDRGPQNIRRMFWGSRGFPTDYKEVRYEVRNTCKTCRRL